MRLDLHVHFLPICAFYAILIFALCQTGLVMKHIFSIILTVVFFVLLAAHARAAAPPVEYVRAHVQKVQLATPVSHDLQGANGTFTLQIEQGVDRGHIVVLKANIPELLAKTIRAGDRVVLSRTMYGGHLVYQIVDVYRIWPLIALFIIFAVLVIWVARGQGVLSFVGMILSFAVILQVVVPQILAGTNAIFVSILASLLMLPLIFYLAHGFHMKTTVAIIATFITLCITSVLGFVMVHVSRLTGLSDEHVYFIQGLSQNPFAIRDLLFAGFVIGALGILDDVSISQTSIAYELHDTNPKQTSQELFSRSMRVGQDHVSSLVNTLVLVYAGASLPLFLLFQQQHMSFDMALSSEIIATEVVRTLVVSIGVVISVPITTALAVWFAKREA